MRRSFLSAACLVALVSAPATAGIISVSPGDPNWASSGNSGGGSSGIVSTPLLDGNGAVAINGDRTRFEIGVANYGLLSNLTAFSQQWTVTQVGGGVALAQAPALRLYTRDPLTGRNIDFVWEDGEQSSPAFVGGAGTLGTTYPGDFFGSAGRVYARTQGAGFGRGLFDAGGNLIPGSDAAQSLATLIATLNSPNTFVYRFGVGVGSSVGNFQGFSDRVTIGFNGADPTVYDFTTAAAIPEPATLAVVGLVGLGGLLARGRRGKK